MATLYYTTTGNVLASDFLQGNTGTVNVANNAATLTLTSNHYGSEVKSFVLEIRKNSLTGNPLYVSSNLYLTNPASSFTSASGGIQSNVTYPDGNYRIHAFTSSGTFTVDQVGIAYPNVEYVVVAGGGASGKAVATSPATGHYMYGAGGGGGGLLKGNVTLSSTGSYAMVIGAGGTNQTNGSNSSIFSDTVIAVGGGAGGTWNNMTPVPANNFYNGFNGGSGGGGGWTNTPGASIGGAAGSGYPGQGSSGQGPGGLLSCGGGGGAGGTTNGPATTLGKNGLIVYWAPTEYGSNVTGAPGMPGQQGQAFAGGGGSFYFSGGPAWTSANNPHGTGGAGGGGSARYEISAGWPYNAGNVNTGGGAASAVAAESPGGSQSGGSGIVILRYRVQ